MERTSLTLVVLEDRIPEVRLTTVRLIPVQISKAQQSCLYRMTDIVAVNLLARSEIRKRVLILCSVCDLVVGAISRISKDHKYRPSFSNLSPDPSFSFSQIRSATNLHKAHFQNGWLKDCGMRFGNSMQRTYLWEPCHHGADKSKLPWLACVDRAVPHDQGRLDRHWEHFRCNSIWYVKAVNSAFDAKRG